MSEPIPSEAITTFLNQAIDGIQSLTTTKKSIPQSPVTTTDETITETCRKHILQVQIDTLQQISKSFNASIDKLQTVLLKLGDGCYDDIVFIDENVEKEIIQVKVKELNDISKTCLCRLILANSNGLLQNYNIMTKQEQKKEEKINKNHLLEFLSLFHAMVHLPDVLHYIQHGENLSDLTNTPSTPIQRMHTIQNILLLSLGYKPQNIQLEKQVYELQTSKNSKQNEYFIDHYVSAIQYVTQKTTIETPLPKLDDRNQGGHTRIISVSLTNPNTSTAPPSSLVMPEKKEMNEKHSLETAQQTTKLEERIRLKLKSWSEEERTKNMEYAKGLQDGFLKKAMELPPGLERVRFMQSLNQGDQELLIMYKIYCQEYS